MYFRALQDAAVGLAGEDHYEHGEVAEGDEQVMEGDDEADRADEIERHEDREQAPPEERTALAAWAHDQAHGVAPGELNAEDRPEEHVHHPVRRLPVGAEEEQPDRAYKEVRPQQQARAPA